MKQSGLSIDEDEDKLVKEHMRRLKNRGYWATAKKVKDNEINKLIKMKDQYKVKKS